MIFTEIPMNLFIDNGKCYTAAALLVITYGVS